LRKKVNLFFVPGLVATIELLCSPCWAQSKHRTLVRAEVYSANFKQASIFRQL